MATRPTRGATAEEIFSKIKNEANWRIQRLERRLSQSDAQNQFDDASGTSSTEIDHAMAVIWKDGGKLYSKGSACGKLMECFTGANFDFGTITKGHTVITKFEDLGPKLQRHELAHVKQYEELGGRKFFWKYAGGYLGGVVRASQFPGVWAGMAMNANGNLFQRVNKWPYEINPMEQEAHAAE